MSESLLVDGILDRMSGVSRFARYGRVTRVVGLIIEAVGIDVALGELCRILSTGRSGSVLAEVVGFHEESVLLMPFGNLEGIHVGAGVEGLGHAWGADVGPGLLGRVLDGLGRPMDGLGDLGTTIRVPLQADPPNPLERQVIRDPVTTGVRAIDGMLSMGRGQRVGIFAGSGVGKSTLLGMIARRSSATVNVIALLGERGREVRDFLENSLGPEGLARSVVIVATGDQSALVRARGALVATAVAEYFRDRGDDVLLMVDSVTRVAMAWREIGLAVGEPPTTRGYPPSVFAALPRLLERAGNGRTAGITGIYTVLVEGDDFSEPVADHVRSVLDGHVVLTRELAANGHYPAIDILQSASRVRDQVVDAAHRDAARDIQRLMGLYREKEDLISVGAYQAGTDPALDQAIRARPAIIDFLRQPPDGPDESFEQTRAALARLHQDITAAGRPR